jgi:hypothetical protein
MTAPHVGRRPCRVSEHLPRRFEIELAVESASRWFRTSVQSWSTARAIFFARDAKSGDEAVQRRDRRRYAHLAVANARDRRSIENGLPIHAGLHPASTVKQNSAPL